MRTDHAAPFIVFSYSFHRPRERVSPNRQGPSRVRSTATKRLIPNSYSRRCSLAHSDRKASFQKWTHNVCFLEYEADTHTRTHTAPQIHRKRERKRERNISIIVMEMTEPETAGKNGRRGRRGGRSRRENDAVVPAAFENARNVTRRKLFRVICISVRRTRLCRRFLVTSKRQ